MKLSKAKVHFIGIGGIGMCGLAELLHNMGASVTGSDLSSNQQTENLVSMGIKVYEGHDASHLGDAEVVVYSSAVKPENVEYMQARKMGIPLIPRAESLAEIMRLKRGVAIAGSHGKTTTTSLTATLFLKAELDPTIVVGGRLDVIKSTAKLGAGDWLIAEADESDGSFQKLSPEIVIITNIDDDHLDYYKTMAQLRLAFLEFANRIPFFGQAIVCGDDLEVRRLFSQFSKRITFYGWDPSNDYCLKKNASTYEVYEASKKVAEFSLELHGRHNALNALASMLAGRAAGIEWNQLILALNSFSGVDRRMSRKGQAAGISFYDDYGHHPTEIEAVLKAFKERYPERRLVTLFQPHRYSRTQLCWDRFIQCFQEADQLYLLDIYPAGEKPIPGVDSKSFFEAIQLKNKHFCGSRDLAKTQLIESLQKDDVFVTLGAGDVWKLGDEIREALG